MGQFDTVSYIIEIKTRMKRLGIDLDALNITITNHWAQPRGFNFVASYMSTQKLGMLLHAHPREFAEESSLSRRIRQTRAYREISKTDGLHITFVPGAPYDGYPNPVGWHVNIHLDSVSMCPEVNQFPGRDKQVCSLATGDAIEDIGRIAKHIKEDLLKK